MSVNVLRTKIYILRKKNNTLIYILVGLVGAYFMIPKFKEMINGLLKKKEAEEEGPLTPEEIEIPIEVGD